MFTVSPILLCRDLIIFVGLDPSVETSFHSISSISNAIVDAGQIQGCPLAIFVSNYPRVNGFWASRGT